MDLAFGHEEHGSCQTLMGLAKEIEAPRFVSPAFSVEEAHGRHIRRQRDKAASPRKKLRGDGRALPFVLLHQPPQSRSEVSSPLGQKDELERRSFEHVARDLRETATLIELDEAQIRAAQSPQDALICASVVGHLRRSGSEGLPAEEESCFVTRDNDFADDGIRADLEAIGCKPLFKFEDALGYVCSRLS